MDNQVNIPLQTPTPATPTPVPVDRKANPYLVKLKLILKPFVDQMKVYWQKVPVKARKLLVVVGVVFLVLFFLAIIAAALSKRTVKENKVVIPTPQVSFTPAPTDVITNPSRYATDSEVLKIESSLKEIQQKLNTTDMKETKLSVPNLDFDVNFDD